MDAAKEGDLKVYSRTKFLPMMDAKDCLGRVAAEGSENEVADRGFLWLG